MTRRGSLVLACMLAATTTAAAEGTRVGVLAIDVAPGLPRYVRATADTSVQQGLRASGYDVKPIKLAPPLDTCTSGPCLADVEKALDVDAVVVVHIAGKDDGTIIEITMYERGVTEPTATVREVCDLCGNSELGERIALATSSVRARADESRAAREKADAQAQQQEQKQPTPPPAAPITITRSRLSIPGIALTGAGALVAAAGVYLLVIDGDGTCSPGDGPVYPDPGAVIRYPDPADHSTYVCKNRYATGLAGGITLGTGIAAMALGVTLLVRGREEHIVLTPVSGGATVGAHVAW